MDIEIIGSRVLEMKCQSVVDFSSALHLSIQDMYTTMESRHGLGLAAPQVGIPMRFFIITRELASSLQGHYFFANPEITWPQCNVTSFKEGCLSLPDVFISIERPELVTVTALDQFGNRFTLENVSGLHSRVIQHEFDHLDGILMHTRASDLDKMMIANKIKKARRLRKKLNR